MNVYDGLNAALFLMGIYVLAQAIHMCRSGKLPSALIAAEEKGKIKDEGKLLAMLARPMKLFGFVMICDGIMGFLCSRIWSVSWFRYIQLAAFLGAWMYFMKKYQDAKAIYIEV